MNKRAFTLIELLIVISIIGVLVTLVVVTVRPIQTKSRDAKRKGDLNLYLTGLDLFKTDFKVYPNHTYYLGKNTADTGAFNSNFELASDLASCQGLSGNGNPTNFSVATDFVTAESNYDQAILKPGFASVNHFLICTKYIDRLLTDTTNGAGANGYQYRVSYDYLDVVVSAALENTNDGDLKYLYNTDPSLRRYYLGTGTTVRHLDDDSDSDSSVIGSTNEFFYGVFSSRPIANGRYLYQCNGKTADQDITRDSRVLTINEPLVYSSNAWRANTANCRDADSSLDDIQSW